MSIFVLILSPTYISLKNEYISIFKLAISGTYDARDLICSKVQASRKENDDRCPYVMEAVKGAESEPTRATAPEMVATDRVRFGRGGERDNGGQYSWEAPRAFTRRSWRKIS